MEKSGKPLVVFIAKDSELRRIFSALVEPTHEVMTAPDCYSAQLFLAQYDGQVDHVICSRDGRRDFNC